jgi:hypothetical protein
LFKNTRWNHFTLLQFISWVNTCRFTNHSPAYLVSWSRSSLMAFIWHARAEHFTIHERRFYLAIDCSINQPTKKLTKGGVLRKRQTSSLARFDHFCVRNALLESALKQKQGVCLR